MIGDLKQPAQLWLADMMQELAHKLDCGDDPSIGITVLGCEMELRLRKPPGVYERREVELYIPKPPPPADVSGAR